MVIDETELAALNRGLEIVIVDNDPITCTLQELKVKSRISRPIRVFQEARKALDFISGATGTDFLVLLDIDMPIMDGWEFLLEWQKTHSNTEIKVIMLSCSISSIDKKRALSFPEVVAYFEKPLYDSHLDIMEKVIGSFRVG